LKNSLKQKIREKKTTFGGSISIAHPDIAELLGDVGLDWIMVDMEHGPMDFAAAQNLLQAMSYSQTVPIARVSWNDLVMIKRTLDIGMQGIVVPWVNTRDDAIRAVKSIRYPPEGLRGYGPRRASLRDPDYFATANREIFLGVQIETQQGVDNIDEILAVEGIDAVLLGPFDLSINLGVPTQWNSPVFTGAVNRIRESAERHNITPGVLAPTEWQKRLREGFRMIMLPPDYVLLQTAARQTLKEAWDFVHGLQP
jgi:2-dehydro-3-deoxyglucarate aldolase